MKAYIGIDPGASGGLACVIYGAPPAAAKMPTTERDLYDTLMYWKTTTPTGEVCAVLERVWSSPGWGHVGAFKFGLNYGACRMALTAAGISFDEVLPQKWQTVMGCRSGKDKNITKRRAQALFPSVTVTHAIADALLIAEFCRRQDRGTYGEESEVRQESAVEIIERYNAQSRREQKAGAAVTRSARPGTRRQRATR